MKGSFFPEYGARINANESKYAAIAFRVFCDAEKAYNDMQNNEEDLLDPDEIFLIDENVAICETFSAFTVEAYLNTYAAACLEDSVFYDNYERLSCLSKLQLISAILYHEHISKDNELFYLLKHCFSSRDHHAHSKSKKFELNSSEYDDEAETEELSEGYWQQEEKRIIKSQRQHLHEALQSAELSIKAIVATACYIDAHDTTAYAVLRLLLFVFGDDEPMQHDKKQTGTKYTVYSRIFREDMRERARSLVRHYSYLFSSDQRSKQEQSCE